MHQALRSIVVCSASRVVGDVHPTKNRLPGGLWQLVYNFVRMNDRFEHMELVF